MAKFTETTTIEVVCPKCGSERVRKAGQQNGQQRYRCNACAKWFRQNGKAPGRRVDAEQVGAAIRMFYSGLSYKQIAESIHKVFDIPEPSKQTIYAWVRQYTDKAKAAMREHPAHVGTSWVADEMQVDVGGQKMWNWNVMDEKTRYILASHLAKERNTAAATAVMEKARDAAAVEPKTIKTDKLGSYLGAIDEVFPYAKHIQSDGHQGIGEQQPVGATARNVPATHQDAARARDEGDRPALLRRLGADLQPCSASTRAWRIRPQGRRRKVAVPFTEWADVVRQGRRLKPSGVVPATTQALPKEQGAAKPKQQKPRLRLVTSRRRVGPRAA